MHVRPCRVDWYTFYLKRIHLNIEMSCDGVHLLTDTTYNPAIVYKQSLALLTVIAQCQDKLFLTSLGSDYGR